MKIATRRPSARASIATLAAAGLIGATAAVAPHLGATHTAREYQAAAASFTDSPTPSATDSPAPSASDPPAAPASDPPAAPASGSLAPAASDSGSPDGTLDGITVSFDITCYTFAGDTQESCGIRLSRDTSVALFAAARAAAGSLLLVACRALFTPFIGADSATILCAGINTYIFSRIDIPPGQTFWVGTSGPKSGQVILVDANNPPPPGPEPSPSAVSP